MIQLLLALRSIHSHSTENRDIRPVNIFLDHAGSVMVGNFVVSRLHTLCEGDSPVHTADAWLYMSPELCAGSACDEETDVWALGVVLYQCCTGKHPFMANSTPALASQILDCKPPPISKETYRHASSVVCSSRLINAAQCCDSWHLQLPQVGATLHHS